MKIYLRNEDKNIYNEDVSDANLEAFAKEILHHFARSLKRIIPDLTIIFVSKEKIRTLNKRFRGIDEPTDVLSFPSEEDGYLGDIVISKEIVATYAEKFSCSFQEELQRDMIHGIMHLLGFEHTHELREENDEEMFRIQENILKKYA